MELIEEHDILTTHYIFNLKIFKIHEYYEGRIEGDHRTPPVFDNLFETTFCKPDKESLIEVCRQTMANVGGEIESFTLREAKS